MNRPFASARTLADFAKFSRKSKIYCNDYRDGMALVVVDELEFTVCPVKNDIEALVEELRSMARDAHLSVVR